MLIKRPDDIRSSDITSESIYKERRRFMQGAIGAGLVAGIGLNIPSDATAKEKAIINQDFPKLPKSAFNISDELTTYKDITTYNNFYEFGTDKSDPARYAHTLQTRPWSIRVEGEVENAGNIDIEEVLKLFTLEERIYRLRCVEGWSMVIPWVGFPLQALLKRFKPTSKAKYVMFVTKNDPKQMPGVRNTLLHWPYVEGLRIDEAMNPLTLLAVGLYGNVLPNQNGAPLRLVVPWKYGFKSIKSIVEIRLVEKPPITTWMRAAPSEYGFYSNVNPEVSHPRWSQKRERRIGHFFKQDTLMFNGYGEQVADLYTGMNLTKNF